MKVYGPYTRKDGRKHVIIYDEVNKKKRTQSYPRYLMEQHLGRTLEQWEQVDHINDDPTDDRLSNFQLLTQAGNNVKSNSDTTEYLDFVCPVCTKQFEIPASQYRHNQISRSCAGPYCSKKCAGKVHN